MKTQETLRQVSWTGYTFESEFPTAANSDPNSDDITWNGPAGLSPSLDVGDPASDRSVSQDTFLSGIAFAIAGGTAVAFFEKLTKIREDLKAKREQRKRAEELHPAESSTGSDSSDGSETGR